jgi:hypothetical protein
MVGKAHDWLCYVEAHCYRHCPPYGRNRRNAATNVNGCEHD